MPILGIDEVGRGPLAGPLVVGAVILPPKNRPWFTKLKDSKKLTAKKREELNTIILTESTTGLGWVPAAELDKIGISEALRLATRRAVKSVQRLHTPFSQIIIDGKVNFLSHTPLEHYVSTCVKADAKIREVSAASIIAKVARDQYMIQLATKYPDYGFDKHVGYGTRAHIAAIYKYGLTDEHRKSFEPCKSLFNSNPIAQKYTHTPQSLTSYTSLATSFTSEPDKSAIESNSHHSSVSSDTNLHKNTTSIGHQAEQAVANYLENRGHTIIERNHKTYFYEIDIISTKDNYIYFTEVKYRKNSDHGSGLDIITPAKLQQMRFAAESYLKYIAADLTIRRKNPLLAVASVSGNLENPSLDWFTLNQD